MYSLKERSIQRAVDEIRTWQPGCKRVVDFPEGPRFVKEGLYKYNNDFVVTYEEWCEAQGMSPNPDILDGKDNPADCLRRQNFRPNVVLDIIAAVHKIAKWPQGQIKIDMTEEYKFLKELHYTTWCIGKGALPGLNEALAPNTSPATWHDHEIEPGRTKFEDGEVVNEAPEHGWTCFHCNATFHNPNQARRHFGGANAKPGCVAKLEGLDHGLLDALRGAEERAEVLYGQLQDAHRRHSENLRLSFKKGYAQGRDGERKNHE